MQLKFTMIKEFSYLYILKHQITSIVTTKIIVLTCSHILGQDKKNKNSRHLNTECQELTILNKRNDFDSKKK